MSAADVRKMRRDRWIRNTIWTVLFLVTFAALGGLYVLSAENTKAVHEIAAQRDEADGAAVAVAQEQQDQGRPVPCCACRGGEGRNRPGRRDRRPGPAGHPRRTR